MEICKNKNTGKYFIYIEKIGNDKAWLVTPKCQVKTLNLSLFNNSREGGKKDFLSRGLISEEQAKLYYDFREMKKSIEERSRIEEFNPEALIKQLNRKLKKMTPEEREKTIDKLKAILEIEKDNT